MCIFNQNMVSCFPKNVRYEQWTKIILTLELHERFIGDNFWKFMACQTKYSSLGKILKIKNL